MYKPSLEKVTGHPIGLMLTRCRVFPREIKSKPREWVKWIRDVWARHADSREMHGLPMGASVEGELRLSWMKMFASPFIPFVFFLFLFLQEAS
jgi:hypothetical protein